MFINIFNFFKIAIYLLEFNLIDNKNNTEKSKLLCVVCNKINFNNNKNKAYKLFEIGYLNNTLCYIKNIETIINNYFN